MMSTLKIYLSFDSVDLASALRLRADLNTLNYAVWCDEDLLAGEPIEMKSGLELRAAHVVLWCVSEAALAKHDSRIYRHLKVAPRYQSGKRPDTVLFLPVRFSECEIPEFSFGSDHLGDLQTLDLFLPNDWSQQLQQLHQVLQRLSEKIEELAASREKRRPANGSQRVATLLHISDLHIGTVNLEDLEVQADHVWRYHKNADNYLGHDYTSLDLLDQFYATLMDDQDIPCLQPEQAVKIPVLMTGDLTCYGGEEQFTQGMAFLGDRLRFGDGRPGLGLGTKTWRSQAVPGDHDHWPGSFIILGGPPVGLSRAYQACPFLLPPIPLSDTGFSLRFMGVDTNAEASSMDRLLNRGKCIDQLDKLAEMLKGDESGEKEARVLLLHHCRSYEKYINGLDTASRERLDRFIVDHDVAVLLSGHLHEPYVQRQEVEEGKKKVTILESRCGTTTQMTTVPHEWRRRFGDQLRPPRMSYNSLLVHQLHVHEGALYWETTTYLKTPDAFKLYVGSDYASANKELSNTVKVWPRA